VQTYPQLFNGDGSVFTETDTLLPPRMVATLPLPGQIPPACSLQACDVDMCSTTCDNLPGCPLQLFVGGVQTPLDFEGGQCSTPCAPTGADCVQSSNCCQAVDGSDSECHKLAKAAPTDHGACRPTHCKSNGDPCTPAASDGGTDPSCSP